MIEELYEFRTTPEKKRRLETAFEALRTAGATEDQIKEYGGALTEVVLDQIEHKVEEHPA